MRLAACIPPLEDRRGASRGKTSSLAAALRAVPVFRRAAAAAQLAEQLDSMLSSLHSSLAMGAARPPQRRAISSPPSQLGLGRHDGATPTSAPFVAAWESWLLGKSR